MKQGLLVAVSGAALVIAGLAGCSSGGNSSSGSSSSSSSSASSEASSSSESSSAAASSGGTKVTIDGQDQNITGSPICTNAGDTVVIAIGQSASAIGITLTSGDSPTVKQVGLGNLGGAALGYSEGAPGGEASATKDGNTYTITGKASGADISNPMAGLVTKSFEINVTCP